MKIVICGSMKLSRKMLEIKGELVARGHEVILPPYTEEYAKIDSLDRVHSESAQNKIKDDLIREYYRIIREGDAVLVLNYDLNGITGYIGGNSFLEMAFAHVLDKKLYLLNDIPDISFKDEIVAMQPIVLSGDLERI